jgi:serine/threonine protein kinase
VLKVLSRDLQEVLGLEFVGPAYDIWHFGCVMFELATGRALLDHLEYERVLRALAVNVGIRNYGIDDCYLLEMTGVLGNLPREVSPLFLNLVITRTLLHGVLMLMEAVGLVPAWQC